MSPTVADDVLHHLCEFGDGQIRPGPDIEEAVARIMPHGMNAAVGKIVDVEELPHRRPGAPDGDRLRTIRLRLVKPPDQCRRHVAVLGMEIVAWTIEIGRHDGNEVGAVLAAIRLAHLDAGDLGDGIPLVRRLERPGQQQILGHRLRAPSSDRCRMSRGTGAFRHPIDARQRIVFCAIARLCIRNSTGIGVVGEDAADLCRGHENRLRLRRLEEALRPLLGPSGRRVDAVGSDDLALLRLQPSHDRRAHHAAVAGDKDPLRRQIIGCELASSPSFRRPSVVVRTAIALGADLIEIAQTISSTSSANGVSCVQPSLLRALVGSPIRISTSVGRK